MLVFVCLLCVWDDTNVEAVYEKGPLTPVRSALMLSIRRVPGRGGRTAVASPWPAISLCAGALFSTVSLHRSLVGFDGCFLFYSQGLLGHQSVENVAALRTLQSANIVCRTPNAWVGCAGLMHICIQAAAGIICPGAGCCWAGDVRPDAPAHGYDTLRGRSETKHQTCHSFGLL